MTDKLADFTSHKPFPEKYTLPCKCGGEAEKGFSMGMVDGEILWKLHSFYCKSCNAQTKDCETAEEAEQLWKDGECKVPEFTTVARFK